MKNADSEQPQDDIAVAITDLDEPGTAAYRLPRTASRVRSVLRRNRLPVTAVTSGIVMLTIFLLLWTAPSVRGLAGTIFTGHTTSALALIPGEDLFYVQADPPWGHLLLDGQTATHLPAVGVDAPLRLSHGKHTLIWRAEPFQEQQCTLSIPPHFGTDTCTYNHSVQMKPGEFASIVTFSESLNTLSTDQLPL